MHAMPQTNAPESIILASASPRRRELLASAGIPFEVIPSGIEEKIQPGETPEQFCRRVAAEKVRDVAARLPGDRRLVVGADTIVVLADQVLGKPQSEEEAAAMLRALAGRSHAVLTGVCVLDPVVERTEERVVRTEVQFGPMSEDEIVAYVATGEPMDKAGAYAIQGRASRYVERIDGCYFNVVGLPIPTLYSLLKQMRA
jgi:septum formation protein